MTELDVGSLYVVPRHEGLPSIYGEAASAVDSVKTYFLHNLEAMTPRIARAPYLFGELLSTADILLKRRSSIRSSRSSVKKAVNEVLETAGRI